MVFITAKKVFSVGGVAQATESLYGFSCRVKDKRDVINGYFEF